MGFLQIIRYFVLVNRYFGIADVAGHTQPRSRCVATLKGGNVILKVVDTFCVIPSVHELSGRKIDPACLGYLLGIRK